MFFVFISIRAVMGEFSDFHQIAKKKSHEAWECVHDIINRLTRALKFEITRETKHKHRKKSREKLCFRRSG